MIDNVRTKVIFFAVFLFFCRRFWTNVFELLLKQRLSILPQWLARVISWLDPSGVSESAMATPGFRGLGPGYEDGIVLLVLPFLKAKSPDDHATPLQTIDISTIINIFRVPFLFLLVCSGSVRWGHPLPSRSQEESHLPLPRDSHS